MRIHWRPFTGRCGFAEPQVAAEHHRRENQRQQQVIPDHRHRAEHRHAEGKGRRQRVERGAERTDQLGSLRRSLNSAAMEVIYITIAPNTDMVTMQAVSGMPLMVISESEKIAAIPTTPPARIARCGCACGG